MTLLQMDQPQLLQVPIIASPFRWTKGTLTALAQMTHQTTLNVPVHRTHCFPWVAKGKVVGPTTSASIDRLDKLRYRHKALAAADQCANGLAVLLQRLFGRCHIQVPVAASHQVAIVPERVAQKIHAGSGVSEVDHLGFRSVQLKVQPGFNLFLDEPGQPSTLIAGQHHEIIRIAHKVRFGPNRRATGCIENLLEPVQIDIGQKRRDHTTLRRSLIASGHLLTTIAIVLRDRYLKPQTDQLQYRAVDNPHLKAFDQFLVRDRVERYANLIPLSTTHQKTVRQRSRWLILHTLFTVNASP